MVGARFKAAMYRFVKREEPMQNVAFIEFKANKSLAVPHRSFLVTGADKIEKNEY